jgi:hypothetical protein
MYESVYCAPGALALLAGCSEASAGRRPQAEASQRCRAPMTAGDGAGGARAGARRQPAGGIRPEGRGRLSGAAGSGAARARDQCADHQRRRFRAIPRRRGRSGWPSPSMPVSRKAPDLAVVSLGGNDMLRGLPPEETRKNLDAILAEFDRRGIEVVLLGMLAPPNLGADYAASSTRSTRRWPRNTARRWCRSSCSRC